MDTEHEFDWITADDRLPDSNSASFDWLADDYSLETPDALNNPLVASRQVAKRRGIIAAKQENLAKVVTCLPPTDTDLFIIGSADGREHSRTGHITANAFDYGSFIPHCIDLLLTETGQPGGITLYVSTWVLNRDTVQMFTDELDTNRLHSLHVLADKFLKRRHTAAVFAQLTEMIQAHPPSRIKLAPNHCKILCMSVAGRYVTITGSANLSAVARTEQYNLTTAPEIYRFYTEQFFEPIFTGSK